MSQLSPLIPTPRLLLTSATHPITTGYSQIMQPAPRKKGKEEVMVTEIAYYCFASSLL